MKPHPLHRPGRVCPPSLLFLAALGIILSATGLPAATLVLTPTDDSYIRATQTNQGSNNLVLVGDTTTASDYLRGCFAFELNQPELIGQTITSATFTLTINGRDTGGSANATVTVNLHELSSSFTNGGVTWTSRDGTNNWTNPGGDFGGVLASVNGNAATVNAGDNFDFTSGLLATAADNAIGGGFYVIAKLETEDTAARNIFRFNSMSQTVKPTLTLEYVPEPSAALLGSLGLLFLLRRRRR